MAKFNSLGSNYNLAQAQQFFDAEEKREEQIETDEKEYFYKGREALRAALRKLNLPKNSEVAITGFTCLAVYEAVIWENLQPVIIDIDETLNMDFEKLKQREKKPRAVIIQNTFGFTQRKIVELRTWTKANKIVLIEDNAHAFGAVYENGEETGTVGDLAIFSASQDKILDAVSGGILIDNRQEKKSPNEPIKMVKTPLLQQKRDRHYPLLTWTIRNTYDLGVGRILHWWAKKKNWLSQPMIYQKEGGFQELPRWQRQQLLGRMAVARAERENRQKKVRLYLDHLSKSNLFWRPTEAEIERSAALRLPVRVARGQREAVLRELEKAGYHLRDFWYDAPIGPRKYLRQKGYEIDFSDLKRANEVCETVINLPTHQEITVDDIEQICECL